MLQVPSTFDLALQVEERHSKEGPERIADEFEIRKAGLVLGWAVKSIEDASKRDELRNELMEEIKNAPDRKTELVPKVLEKFDFELNPQLFEEDPQRCWLTLRQTYISIAFNWELERRLSARIPRGKRLNIIRAWIEMQCEQLDTFRDNMIKPLGKEGQMPLGPESQGSLPETRNKETKS